MDYIKIVKINNNFVLKVTVIPEKEKLNNKSKISFNVVITLN